jgi:hypothetical protein
MTPFYYSPSHPFGEEWTTEEAAASSEHGRNLGAQVFKSHDEFSAAKRHSGGSQEGVMTATVAEHPALADLKDCVTSLLLDLATLTGLITYDCEACPDSLTSMCAYHLAQAATRHRLKRAASMAAGAETADALEAAIVYAGVER